MNEVIAQLQAQVDNIATGEDVDQINESINQVELDLEELLASNKVFTGDLTINSEATLEFAESLGGKVKKPPHPPPHFNGVEGVGILG